VNSRWAETRKTASSLVCAGIGTMIGLPRRFVIFTSGRSGSELLASLLHAHPRVHCDGEELALPRPFRAAHVRGRAVRTTLAHRMGRSGPDVYGWKLITNHLRWYPEVFPNPTAFLGTYAQPPGLLVTLRRADLLNQTLSLLHAEHTQFHYQAGKPAPRFEPFEVEPENLLSQLYYYENDERWLTETVGDLPHLSLVYEDDLATPKAQQDTANRVFDRLGLPPAPVDARLVPVAPPVPRDRITNFEAVASALRGTRYERLLNGS
jgi:LPS sulfotransferase NodH